MTARRLATAAGLGLLAFACGLICGAYVQLVLEWPLAWGMGGRPTNA